MINPRGQRARIIFSSPKLPQDIKNHHLFSAFVFTVNKLVDVLSEVSLKRLIKHMDIIASRKSLGTAPQGSRQSMPI